MSDQGATRDYASGLAAQPGRNDRWLSVYEVGAMTLQHPDSVRRWISEGRLPAEHSGRLGWRVRESDVERLLHETIRVEGRNVGDHALSSNVVPVRPDVPSETARAGAGWPFNRRSAKGADADRQAH